MAIEVRPATVFDDVKAVLGPKAGGRERLLVLELPPPVQGERRAA
jgi:hypothetical protein